MLVLAILLGKGKQYYILIWYDWINHYVLIKLVLLSNYVNVFMLVLFNMHIAVY